MPTERQQIEATIRALEAQRPVLGDAVVAMAIAPLHDRLTALDARAQGEQQLKTVTILFMDVVGSTQLSQYLDPEEVHAVMDTALERLSALVRVHSGRILKYAGDSLLAVFGAEQVLENDAERAVCAGLAILGEAPRFAAEIQATYGLQGFNLRVGINTGRVLLGGGVDAEGSIRGTPVNIAARMEQTAPPGGLRISHQTYRHVRGVFEVEAQAPIEIKGITGAVRSYLVFGVKPRAFRVANRGLDALEQVAEELDEDAFRARAAGMRASLALVVGDYPGVEAAAARAIAWAEGADDGAAALRARINWARALQFQGHYAAAQAHVEESLVLAREVGDRKIEATALGQLGILATQQGRFGIARDYYRQALGVARAIGHRGLESGMINNLGETEQQLGNYEAALEQFQAGRRLCAEIGQRLADSYLLSNMALSAFRRGDAVGSIAWVAQAMQLAEELKDRDLQAILHCIRGHAYAARSEWDQSSACYEVALALFREIGRATMPPEPIAGLARVALARGDVGGAMAAIAEVVAHFDAGGSVAGTEDPLWIYLTCHEVLAAAAAPRAAEFLERSYRLLSERAEPLGAAERATFLGNVPSHRAIVAAWEQRAYSDD